MRESGVQRVGPTLGARLRVGGYRLYLVLATLVHVAMRRILRGPRHASWDFRYEFAATLLRTFSRQILSVPLDELRRHTLASSIPSELRASVKHELGSFSGLYAETFTPATARAGRTLLYIHGGGYILCSPATHRDLVSRLAQATDARSIAVDYRKAPEYPYPAGLEDCEQAYRTLLADGVAPEDIILAGDSAGAGLALSVLLRARDAGLPLPGCAVLLSPWCDLSRSGDSIRDNARYDYLSPESLPLAVDTYLQGQDPLHPHVSHVHADFSGLPPLLVVTGDAELFYSENLELVSRVREQGVPVVHVVEPGRVHVSALLSTLAPSAAATFAHVAAFVAAESGQARVVRTKVAAAS